MAAGGTRGWKIFGIIVIVVVAATAIGAAAFFIGRGSGEDKGATTTPTQTQAPAATPGTRFSPEEEIVVPEQPAGGAEGEAGGEAAGPEAGGEQAAEPEAGGEEAPEEAAPAERYVTGEGGGESPCIDGQYTRTYTIYWSDGSTDTTTETLPC